MPTFQRCDDSVLKMARDILLEFNTHTPLIDAKVSFDFVFAFADVDPASGAKLNDALSKGGVKCLGMARKLSLKDRALGRADAEISIDGDWWNEATIKERRALLDHELHHIAVKQSRGGAVRTDDLDRPLLTLRHHDFEFGWFNVIAERHGIHSTERKQAARIMEIAGQYYFPEIANATDGRLQKLELAR